MTNPFLTGRHAGILVPLFSIPSTSSWGIGEIPDLGRFARWLREAGQDFVQLLPVTAVSERETSPYSALSAMAIDRAYVGINDLQDFRDIGGEHAMRPDLRARLDRARRATTLDYLEVRDLKRIAFEAAFDHFYRRHWIRDTQRAAELRAFIEHERWWLEDYALFRALRTHNRLRPWWEWDEDVRRRDPDALSRAAAALERDVLMHKYVQWVADSQWHQVKADAGIGVFGDYPFMVSRDSADVWARQGDFLHDASVGTPPDAFSETGQNWGLPVCRWDVMAGNDFEWLRQRAARSASLYDGYRIDHLVGFYRTFVRPPEGEPYFTPAVEADQLALGERLMQIFLSSGPLIVAEDLGVIPDFVRASLQQLNLPGYRVLRWERDWHAPSKPFKDPAGWPPLSVGTSGTHDTEPLIEWWKHAGKRERERFLELPSLARLGLTPDAAFTPAFRDAILDALFQSGSNFLILPLGDVFGWPDRINTPAVIRDSNWRWRLPWPVDALDEQPEARARAAFLRRQSEKSGRLRV